MFIVCLFWGVITYWWGLLLMHYPPSFLFILIEFGLSSNLGVHVNFSDPRDYYLLFIVNAIVSARRNAPRINDHRPSCAVSKP